eukprot:COSAG06_NODE_7060_length_2651_cov_6.391850_2_plen_177_part_00
MQRPLGGTRSTRDMSLLSALRLATTRELMTRPLTSRPLPHDPAASPPEAPGRELALRSSRGAFLSTCNAVIMIMNQFLMNCLIPRYSNPFLFRGYVSRSPPLARAPLLGVVVAAMSPRTLAYHARNHLPTYTCARPLPRPLCEHTAAAHAAQHGSNLHTAHRRATAGPEERRGCRC